MFFNEIAKKYELLKEAINSENTIDKINKRIENLKKKEESWSFENHVFF